MKKFRISFLLYILISIYTFDNVYAVLGDNEVEKAGENVNFILNFFSAEKFINIFFAIIAIVFIFFISKIINYKIISYMENLYSGEESGGEEIIGVVSRTINVSMLVLGSSIVLGILGIDMGIFMGGIGFGLGFTLKTFLTNFVAGITMVTQGFYHNGDIIEIGGRTGKIKKIHALFTLIEQFDGVAFYIPNTKFMEENVSNYFSNDKRRLDIDISVDYDTDILKAKTIITKILDSYPGILNAPSYDIVVEKLHDNGILLKARFWISSKANFISIRSDITETINLLFSQSNIVIPFPQITISNRIIK